MTTLAHKIALHPTPAQAVFFASSAGTARYVWNHALSSWRAWWREYHRAQQRGADYEKPTWAGLKRALNACRAELLPWTTPAAEKAAGPQAHRDCWSQPITDLQTAYRNHFKAPQRVQKPAFKSKRERASFYVANDKISFRRRAVKLPKIGWVRARESLRFEGRVLSARITQTAGRWFVSVQVELAEAPAQHVGAKQLGIDLGIHHAITLSEPLSDDRQTFDAPKPLQDAQLRLKRRQQALSRSQRGSNRRRRIVGQIARLHARIRSIRQDWIYKVTTSIVRESQAIGIEDLSVSGMMRARRFSRALSDVSLGEIRRQLTYKCVLYGVELVTHDRWYPSSQLCSGCGARQKLSLNVRTYECPACGLVLDRDVNAAKNLTPGQGAGAGESPRAVGESLLRATDEGEKRSLRRESNPNAGQGATKATSVQLL